MRSLFFLNQMLRMTFSFLDVENNGLNLVPLAFVYATRHQQNKINSRRKPALRKDTFDIRYNHIEILQTSITFTKHPTECTICFYVVNSVNMVVLCSLWFSLGLSSIHGKEMLIRNPYAVSIIKPAGPCLPTPGFQVQLPSTIEAQAVWFAPYCPVTCICNRFC